MVSSGFLVPPKQDPSKEHLWVETWKRIDRFLPDLRADLALEEPEEDDKGGPGMTGRKVETKKEGKEETSEEEEGEGKGEDGQEKGPALESEPEE